MKKIFVVCILMLFTAACTFGNARRQAYVDNHPETKYARQILEGKITKGMWKEEIEASLGNPSYKDKTAYSEIWVYSLFPRTSQYYNPFYVVFYQGRVSNWYRSRGI